MIMLAVEKHSVTRLLSSLCAGNYVYKHIEKPG